MDSSPAVITVAITGSLPMKKDNPGVPVTPAEQVEAAHEAFEAGASLVHIHVRDSAGKVCSDRKLFAEVQDGIRKHCPEMIIQFSTGGRGRVQAERAQALDLRPDMASLATGSVNFATTIYENPPDFVEGLAGTMLEYDIKPEIEVFDSAMLYAASSMAERGLLRRPLHVQFVLGIVNAMPARRGLLEFLVKELKELEPDATWCAMGIGKNQLIVNRWCLEMGGQLRTGFEDNVRFDSTRLARNNAELVQRVASMCSEFGRHPASAQEARQLLSLSEALAAGSANPAT
jgi:3-keto-5-aminohexanoate cleavage enzyme